MPNLRPEEAWAGRCIEAALDGVEVVQYDFGGDSQFDLAIQRDGVMIGAVEVTAVVDAPVTAAWKLLNPGGRWIEPGLCGGWIVSVDPEARARVLKKDLPALLASLESAGVTHVRVRSSSPLRSFERAASRLGIVAAFQGPTAFPGSIYPSVEQDHNKRVGVVADTSDALADWLGPWIRDPVRADNLKKLRRSTCQERHLFIVFPGFADAPFSVSSILMRADSPLPTRAPELPDGLTHIWAASTWDSGCGMRWSPASGWQQFDTTPRWDED